MANGKSSFILYCDLIHTVAKLPNDKAGELFKHILSYVNDENPVAPDLIIELTFEPIKQHLKRDLRSWEQTRGEKSKAGKLGGLKSGEARRSKAKQNEANEADASETKQDEANEAVIVSVTDTAIVTVTEDKPTADAKIDHETFLRNLFAENETAQAHREALHLAARVEVTKDHARKFNASLLTESKHHTEEKEWRKHFRNWLTKGGHKVGYEGKEEATEFNFKLISKKQ